MHGGSAARCQPGRSARRLALGAVVPSVTTSRPIRNLFQRISPNAFLHAKWRYAQTWQHAMSVSRGTLTPNGTPAALRHPVGPGFATPIDVEAGDTYGTPVAGDICTASFRPACRASAAGNAYGALVARWRRWSVGGMPTTWCGNHEKTPIGAATTSKENPAS